MQRDETNSSENYANCVRTKGLDVNKRFHVISFTPFWYCGAALVNTFKICYCFRPSKPVLRSNSCLSRASLLHLFVVPSPLMSSARR